MENNLCTRNTAILPTKYQAFIEARTYTLKNNFKEKKGNIVAKNNCIDGLLDLKKNIVKNFESIKLSFDKSSKNNDWQCYIIKTLHTNECCSRNRY